MISGTYGSRKLIAPTGMGTRPTSDKLRETLFNVLALEIRGCTFADLYAGSGAVGIEALSRGAARVYFAENTAGALACLRKNLKSLEISSGATVCSQGALSCLRKAVEGGVAFDFVFLDPPYEDRQGYDNVLKFTSSHKLLAKNGIVIAEHSKRSPLEPAYGNLERTRVLEQGDSALSFYRVRG